MPYCCVCATFHVISIGLLAQSLHCLCVFVTGLVLELHPPVAAWVPHAPHVTFTGLFPVRLHCLCVRFTTPHTCPPPSLTGLHCSSRPVFDCLIPPWSSVVLVRAVEAVCGGGRTVQERGGSVPTYSPCRLFEECSALPDVARQCVCCFRLMLHRRSQQQMTDMWLDYRG